MRPDSWTEPENSPKFREDIGRVLGREEGEQERNSKIYQVEN